MSLSPPSLDAFLDGDGGSSLPEAEVARRARAYLASGREYLCALHDSGASGAQVGAAHSDLVDALIRRLFQHAEEIYFADAGGDPSPFTIVAVGGYARREMNLESDVDLLFLYRGALTPHVSRVAERMLYWLWDAAVSVGGAIRTIGETLKLAHQDASVRTAVLDPRFLTGSGVLFHEFAKALREELCAHPDQFIAEQRESLAKRHVQFGDTLYLLQPNVKEGPGALRDYHLSLWAMQVTQPGSRGFEGFLHLGLLTEAEVAEYRQAVDFLWRVRNELHRLAGRKNDQLSFELQERIAERFGYGSGGEDDDELPVERFMRDYYRHANAIRSYSSLVIEQSYQRVRRLPRRRKLRETQHGFRIAEGQLEIPHARLLRDTPQQLLRAFAIAQQHDVPLTRKAQRLVRENLHRIDDAFRASREARELWLQILDSPQRVTRTLTSMNEVGLLGRLLPEWEHIVCRWQQVMYHTFTVDVHSIFLVEELRRLWLGKYEAKHPELTALMRSVEDRPVLFLGCLFHDLGKGFGGDHSARGALRAREACARFGLETERTERVIFLVDQHLKMSHLAQRRDLSDPKLIWEFAKLVGDRTNLKNLYLLTFADVRASSASAWSDWKGQLLRELFERTAELLEADASDAHVAMDLLEKRVELRREGAAAELRGMGVGAGDIEAFFDAMPRRYLTAHSPRQIARHARVLLGLGPERQVNTAVRDMRGGFSELIVATRDTHGLFSKVAGVLTASGINILGAHVYSTRTGLALEVYRLTTPPGGEAERELAWSGFRSALERVLTGQVEVAELLRRRGRPLRREAPSARKPESVTIENEESDFYTIVDVVANDRLGLLHDLTRTIAEHGFEIYISKAATILDQVTDTFYLKDRDGRKIEDPAAVLRLQTELLAAARAEQVDPHG